MSLCNITDVKSYLDMPVDRADTEIDTLLASYILAISSQISDYCDRTFETSTYTERHDGDGSSIMVPRRYPVTAVTTVWEDQGWDFADSSKIDSDDYRISKQRYVVLNNITFTVGIQNIKITYTGGYTTIPSDLKHACIMEVARTFKQRKDIHVSSISMEDGSITKYDTNFLPSTVATLNFYRNIGIC